jgi:hypothetical protein
LGGRVIFRAPETNLWEFNMSVSRFAQYAAVVIVALSATAAPSFAHDDKKVTTLKVAPLPALGTGLPGLIVLAGGLAAIVRRRR